MALAINRIVHVNTQEVHMAGRSNCFKIAHRRLINLRMLTRCSDPLAASRCGSLGPWEGGSTEGQSQPHPLGRSPVCLPIYPGRPAWQLAVWVSRLAVIKAQLPCFLS